MLRRCGLASEVVGSAREAVQAFARGCHSIILLDIRLPDGNGLELVKRLRQLENPAQPTYIIAQTAFVFDDQREDFLRAGMDDYIPKPISLTAFINVITRAVETLS